MDVNVNHICVPSPLNVINDLIFKHILNVLLFNIEVVTGLTVEYNVVSLFLVGEFLGLHTMFM